MCLISKDSLENPEIRDVKKKENKKNKIRRVLLKMTRHFE